MDLTPQNFPPTEMPPSQGRDETNEQIRKRWAIAQFCTRKRVSLQVKEHDNSKDRAGDPMAFYCTYCGCLAEIVAEDYLFSPRRTCSQCEGLKQEGWLQEAKKSFEKEANQSA